MSSRRPGSRSGWLRHPGLEEDGAAFHVPARRQVLWAGQEVVEDRFRMLLDGHRLAAEEAAPGCVLAVPHVDGRDMGELVIGEREEALAR